MSFGLCGAPATFCRLMTIILAGLLWVICIRYIDDIIIYAQSQAELTERLDKVFTKLREFNFKIKPSQMCFIPPRNTTTSRQTDRHPGFSRARAWRPTGQSHLPHTQLYEHWERRGLMRPARTSLRIRATVHLAPWPIRLPQIGVRPQLATKQDASSLI